MRLVVQDFSQVYRVGLTETFASMIRRESLRMFLVIVTSYDLELHQIDLNAAYLTRDLQEENKEIYMQNLKDIKVRKCNKKLVYHI